MDTSPTLYEISLSNIKNVKLGHASDYMGQTGVSVLLFPKGAPVGVDISGGGPASRETPLAMPLTADNPVHAIVFSGGSAFGLAASDGVMKYLREHDMGYRTKYGLIPLVLQSCIYDLGVGSCDAFPDSNMGYEACVDAEKNVPWQGGIGAGVGATVGKILDMEYASPAGLGIYAVRLGKLKVAAVVVLNAFGDVFDPSTGVQLSGLRNPSTNELLSTNEQLFRLSEPTDFLNTNTTVGAVITNGKFSKAELCKIASMTRSAFGKCISPVGTMADGDTIYAASVGDVDADINVVGAAASHVMCKAILSAARPDPRLS